VTHLRIGEWRKKPGESARERKITYQELLETCEDFEQDEEAYNEAWLIARKFVDWKNLDSLSLDDIENKVILFLNRWACHLPKDRRLFTKLKDVFRQNTPFLKALEGEAIQDFNLEKKKEVEEKEHKNSEVLLKVFRNFSLIGCNFREVAASKVLHMINPSLFVMWDNAICEAYGVKKSPSEYVHDFIPLMKRKANEIIESYIADKKCDREQAVTTLNQFRPLKTLAKMLDEYNYMKYTRGL